MSETEGCFDEYNKAMGHLAKFKEEMLRDAEENARDSRIRSRLEELASEFVHKKTERGKESATKRALVFIRGATRNEEEQKDYEQHYESLKRIYSKPPLMTGSRFPDEWMYRRKSIKE